MATATIKNTANGFDPFTTTPSSDFSPCISIVR